MRIGEVASLWCFPVKSMQGVELESAVLTGRGVLGDRAYAIVERRSGLVASAKHPRKWERLFACRAAYVTKPTPGAPLPPVRITLPDGTELSSAHPDVDRLLSSALECEVFLTMTAPFAPIREADRSSPDAAGSQTAIRREPMGLAAPPGTFFDYAPVHLLTTATMDRLSELYPVGRFVARRFRANIVVAPTPGSPGFVENGWLGRTLRTEPGVRISVIDPCPRCVVTTLAQDDLPHDPGILKAVARHSSAVSVTLAPGSILTGVAGIYATVSGGGTLDRGDSLFVE